jgi:2-dehydro-3-deoxy-D-gluconate 5-dehydrogenase
VTTTPLAELLNLTGRVAVVTGAAQGFGAAIARRVAEAGAHVVLADYKPDRLARLAGELASQGRPVSAATADISQPADAERIAAAAQAAGGFDILVNNAGVFSNYLVPLMPPEEFTRIIGVNVVGTFLCSREAVRAMLAQGRGGTIVNIASVDAFQGSAEGLSHYTTSKHAVAGLTRSLAMELAPAGIRVNAVCPGAARTEGAMEHVAQGAPAGIDLAAQWDAVVARTPLGRLCTPDDVARAVVFLASDLAAFVTGVLLPVDGGILVHPLEGYVPATSAVPDGARQAGVPASERRSS